MKRFAVVVFAVVVLAGCVRAMPPTATVGDADRSHLELADLQHGRDLLVRKCGGSCHQVPMPSQHLPSEWPGKLDEMAQRAGVDGAQRRLIEQYLVTMSAR